MYLIIVKAVRLQIRIKAVFDTLFRSGDFLNLQGMKEEIPN